MPTDNVLEYGMQMNIEDDSAASLQSSWKGTKKEEKKVEDSQIAQVLALAQDDSNWY